MTHCVKRVQIRSFFQSVFSRIQSKYRIIRTRKNSVFGVFSCSGMLEDMSRVFRKILHKYNKLDQRCIKIYLFVLLNLFSQIKVPEKLLSTVLSICSKLFSVSTELIIHVFHNDNIFLHPFKIVHRVFVVVIYQNCDV